MQSLNSSTLFPCQQCCQVTTSWQVSNVAMRGGAPSTQDWRFEVLRLPGASAGFWLYDRSVTPKHHDSKRKGHGDKSLCSLHAVPLDSRGGGTKGAIKILQINYTKKKRQIIYLRNLYKAFTSPSSFVRTLQGGEGEKNKRWTQNVAKGQGWLFNVRIWHIPTFIVDLSISINVCFSDHLINLFISQLLPEVCHHMAQLSSTDVSVTILNIAAAC